MNQVYEQYSQDPDETFKMYVDRLMKAKPRFGGTFATPQQQGQDATSKATGGLLTGLFPEYADRMGGGGGSDMPSVNSGSAPGLRGNGPSGLTSADVDRARNMADFFAGSGRGLAQLGGAVLGPVGMLAGLAAPISNWNANRVSENYFNDLQGRIDATPLTSGGGYDYAGAGVNPTFGASNPYYGDVGYDGPTTGPSFSPTGGGEGGGGSPSDFGGMSNQGEGGPDSYGGW
jgi:hypothetical protein